MKFTIDRRALLDRLNIVSRAISLHSPKPILSGLYMAADQDHLTLIGWDTNLAIRSRISPHEDNHLYIETDGRLVVEARYLQDIVRKMEADSVVFELVDNNILVIRDTTATFKLRVLPATEYPQPNFERPDHGFSLKADLLDTIVRQVGFAASEKDLRAVLLGIHFLSRDGELICAATDSYRLARKTMELEGLPDFEMTIPVKTLNEVVRSCREEESVYICAGEKKVQFHFGDNLIQSALLDGSYPDVNRIIPKEFRAELLTDARRLLSIMERSMIYQSERVNVVRMACDQREVQITSSSKEVGSSDQFLYDMHYEGDPIRISFNGLFMQQALRGLDCKEQVRLQFISELKPIRITNPQDPSLEMIVVPLRTH